MAMQASIYRDIATRTGGDIYIGVVGPVRTGKSTFIKRFMEEVVLPNIEDEGARSRATDEMPQSGSGKNVMTTEPKFVPDEAVRIEVEEGLGFRMKLIDCVGFPVPGAGGLEEDGKTRMVNTPWSDQALPFEEAATLGTKKVITDHATVGVVITTDGSIGDIPREAYGEAEENIITQMKETGKPFVVILNTQSPDRKETKLLAQRLSEQYGIPVLPCNCFLLKENDFALILKSIVLQFPIRELYFQIPTWICSLAEENPIRKEILTLLDQAVFSVKKAADLGKLMEQLEHCDHFDFLHTHFSDLGTGTIAIEIRLDPALFFRVLSENCGTVISCEEELLNQFASVAENKQKYDKVAQALQEVEESGYGIVTPSIEDLHLEEPEIVKHAGGYGVKLKASAPSIHMIRANIQAEVSPIVGSERQSEDIVKFLLKEFEEDPTQIWHSNMFGKSLYELVNEGLNTKLNHMPQEARIKLGETLQKIINDGSGGLICIIL
jgi:stage IV sporulation protein A